MFHRLIALATLCLANALFAQSVPTTINYQGRLTDNTPAQVPVNAAVPIRFAIWDAPAGGTMLWQEPASGGTSVLVVNGIFNVALGGNGVPIPPAIFTGASSTRYLEITINPGPSQETLVPRQLLSSTPYAARAETAVNADNATTAASAISSAALGGIVAASWQRRIGTACPAGTALSAVAVDGTPTCVATAGLSLASAYCTASQIVTPTSPNTPIPGLSSTVTLPANGKILISTYGGVQTTSAVAGGFSAVDVSISVDGVIVSNGGYQRIVASNTTGFIGMINYWSMTTSPPLAAGTHTITVRSQGVASAGNANATVCGNNTSILQGELSVLVLSN